MDDRWAWICNKCCQTLSTSESCDVYNMTNDLIKSLISSIAAIPPTLCLNCCLHGGTFPEDLKLSRNGPIYKKGSGEHPGSFTTQMQSFQYFPNWLKSLHIISYINVWRKMGLLTLTLTVITLTYFVFAKINQQWTLQFNWDVKFYQHMKKFFCSGHTHQLSKAFDCVSHEDLIQKLYQYWVRDLELKFFESYISNRT